MKVRVYHNRACSKSRGVLEILDERGVDVELVDYLADPLSADELRELCRMLDVAPRDLLRTNEAPYAERGLDDPAVPDDEILAAMATDPILIQRPIVVTGDRAIVGRPPERVLDLLDGG